MSRIVLTITLLCLVLIGNVIVSGNPHATAGGPIPKPVLIWIALEWCQPSCTLQEFGSLLQPDQTVDINGITFESKNGSKVAHFTIPAHFIQYDLTPDGTTVISGTGSYEGPVVAASFRFPAPDQQLLEEAFSWCAGAFSCNEGYFAPLYEGPSRGVEPRGLKFISGEHPYTRFTIPADVVSYDIFRAGTDVVSGTEAFSGTVAAASFRFNLPKFRLRIPMV